MSLPILIPSPPTASRPTDLSSPDLLLLHSNSTSDRNIGGNNVASKRKPNKRLNTAEHRAVHNAVERARRETLNGRFLDLAKLLPNLSQIRRPSKSAIVNSSIAHLNACRRHRALASRELRILKLESDHLRKELNEWRDRAGIARVEEPVRGEGFSMVLNQELEAIPVLKSGGYEDEEYLDDASSEGDYNTVQSMDEHGMMSQPTISINTNVSPPYLGTNQGPPFLPQPSPHQAVQRALVPSPPYDRHDGVSYELSDANFTTGYVESQQQGKIRHPQVPFDRQMQNMQMIGGRGMNGGSYPMMVQ
ncbi:hypothetical protein L218DRAFT_989899 [Marasmius fiardii PR-910]|nr:hypothetical protein L218DRAFT_989899 [Marasmius fiardii PR-910]